MDLFIKYHLLIGKKGSKAGIKNNTQILNSVTLVSVFGSYSNVCKDLVKQSKELNIPVLEVIDSYL